MRASKAMQHRVMNTPNIKIHWNTTPVDVIGEKGVDAVLVKDSITGVERKMEVTGFFVAIGHNPNTSVFKGWIDMDETGYIIAKPGTAQTNVEGVFAAGDCADKVYRQAVTSAGTGCMAALDAERYLAAKGH
jgi:thioredoxin reductase (NADPH)